MSGNCNDLITELTEHPGEVATVTLSSLVAPVLVRRQVRAALDLARIRGAEVDAREQRGLLDSVFAVRMRGTDKQLLPTLRTLNRLA